MHLHGEILCGIEVLDQQWKVSGICTRAAKQRGAMGGDEL
jgi:hypothetical protein